MNLVEPKDLINANEKINKLVSVGFAKFLMHILRLSKINKLYSQIDNKEGIEFIDALLQKLKINYEFDESELKNIPEKGPFIAISNHPFGGIDGILLIKMMHYRRTDFKVMANFLLKKIIPLRNYFFGEKEINHEKNFKIDTPIEYLQKGNAIGIFPAGEVSSYNADFKVVDKQWSTFSLRYIKNAEVPILPVYFQGNNSTLYHLLGLIHPNLRTVKLPSELLNKKKRPIKIRIGKPIPLCEQKQFVDIDRFGRYLRARTFGLGTQFKVKDFFQNNIVNLDVEKIVIPVDSDAIFKEINKIKKEYLLFVNNNYEVYCAPTLSLPNIHKELGRLREITFRKVGEGTNRSIDIDEYDLYFHQLFIWDTKEKKIVGGYRVGKGKDIIREYGVKGFYIYSLFKIKRAMISKLKESLELGRSFIIEEYQKKLLPLFLLWKGILYLLLKNPEYRYLIGPVSISNEYSELTKNLLIKFIMRYHFNYEIAHYIKPRNKFKFKTQDIDIDIILEAAKDDINIIDNYIGDIEPSGDKLPILLKKYIAQGAKIIGFNVDPKFNDCLDGLIILDLFDVPMKSLEALAKEIDDEEIMKRFMTKPT